MKARLIIGFLLAALGFWSYFVAYPYFIQAAIEWKISKGKNILLHSKLPTSKTPDSPNPDFIYSIAFYDLKDGDLLLTGKVPEGLDYFSIAFYGSNTLFYSIVKPDQKSDTYAIRLVKKSQRTTDNSQTVIESPSEKGTLILRYMCRNSRDLTSIAKIQEVTRLSSVP